MFRTTKLCSSLVAAFGGSLLLSALPAMAQQTMERVEVTGSSIKRIDAETALPVQIITREEIRKTGAANVEQLMQTVAAVASSGGQVASSASGATTGGISSISLRGLTSLRTLVLVNGRRVAPYGIGFTNDSVSVDVNSIPLSAIERIEVLKDGASAVYGSDAIAGVVNFILRNNYKGIELTADLGGTTQGGANIQRIAGTFGRGDIATDKYNFMIVGSYQKESGLFGRDRDFAKHSYNEQYQNDTTSGNTFPANIAVVNPDLTAGGSRNPTAATGCVAPYSFIDPLFPPNRCRFDPASLVTLVPATERASIFGSARFALTADLEAFLEASFTRNTQRTIIQPVPISDQFTIPLNNPLANQAPYNKYTTFPSSTIILKSTSPFYPTAYVESLTGDASHPDLFVRYRAAVSGNRDLTDISEAPRLTFGAKGLLAGWDFDSAFLYSSSKVKEQVNDGYPIYSKILPLLNSGTVNFFGPNSAAVDAQIRATNFTGSAFEVTSSLTSVTAKASKEIAQLPAGGLALAAGGEFRNEKYEFNPSIEWQQGDLSGYGGQGAAVNKKRNVTSLFSEINVPILKSLEANAAIRYDRYQGSGSATTPKVSLRWQPSSAFLMRASVGKGFRAPSLADLYTPNTLGVSQTGLSDPVRCPITDDGVKDCQTQFPVTFGGKASLKPERSISQTLGMVIEPSKNVSLSLDYFRIRLTDTIQQGLPQDFILKNLSRFGSYITRGPNQTLGDGTVIPGPIINIDQTNDNIGATRLSGVDIDFKWRIPTESAGRITYAFSGTYFTNYETQNPDGTYSPAVATLETSTTGGVIPRWKTYQAVNWAMGPWDTTLALNWQSGYKDVDGNNGDPGDFPNDVGPYKTIDAQVSYSGFKNLRLTFGIKNLLDKDPPYTNQGFSFQSGYDPQYADPRGRFIYARLAYSFE